MRKDFLRYYKDELSYLREAGAAFALRYPTVAGRLGLEDQSDPHVERVVQAFAFIASRIHLHIDDEFPEITEALLQILYPNFTRPIPSMAIVQFRLDPTQGKQTTLTTISRDTPLLVRRGKGFDCKFSTRYPVSLWPIEVVSASWLTGAAISAAGSSSSTPAAIQIELVCHEGLSFRSLALSSLRFYLNGPTELAHIVYELLLNHCHTIRLLDPDPGPGPKIIKLSPNSLSPAGFKEDESMYDSDARTFSGYRILQEFFAFPKKYFFVDLGNLEASRKGGSGEDCLDCHRRLNIQFLLSPFEREDWRPPLERGIPKQMFSLGCTPVVNLFSYSTDAIPIRQTNYQSVIPLPPRTELFSVEGVYNSSPEGASIPFRRFFATDAGEQKGKGACYWQATRRRDRQKEGASEYVLSLVDRQGALANPPTDSVFVKCKCTNGTVPSEGDCQFVVEGFPELQSVECLQPPTRGSAAASGPQSLWRLVSQLSLNHLSLVEEGKEALQWLLQLHNLSETDLAAQSIRGIVNVKSEPHFARVSSEHGTAFVRGKLVELTLDETQFAGSGVYLFTAVLERFLALYTSMNSFSALRLKTLQRGEKIVASWPPRAGAQAVL